jgi:2OG-Fe(II) oxygenase superfamily
VSVAKNEISDVVLRTLRCSVEFNQVLSVAYMEGMGMKFHSDGEVGLGDVVASLSLGSPARMSFRLRSKPGKGTFDHSAIGKEEYEHWFDHACRLCRKSKPRVDEESSTLLQTELMCPTLFTVDIQHVSVRHYS